ncbi:hypothetical protein ACK32R_20825 [Aeromonas dhakensis]|uniref:hypothetical protein n=1 Tax=Aeromonas dhakensis TaxID=196024 RepID=UPI003985F871
MALCVNCFGSGVDLGSYGHRPCGACHDKALVQNIEQSVTELELLVDWHQGFMLIFVFSRTAIVGNTMKKLIGDLLKCYGRPPFEIVSDGAPNHLLAVVEKLFDKHPHGQPVWLDLHLCDNNNQSPAVHDGNQWAQQTIEIMSALNKGRTALEQSLGAPLFIHLPDSFAPEVATYAPDLWTIRQLTMSPTLDGEHGLPSLKVG